jgi:hypothetical protein
MTELAASAIALMFDVEVAVAIACASAWFEFLQASEGRSAKQADVEGAATARTTPDPLWPAFAPNHLSSFRLGVRPLR